MMGFYWLLGLILYHPAGRDGLLAVCSDNGTKTFKCHEPASVKCLVADVL